MRREFSEEKRQEIFRLLDEIDNREWKSFMEWAGSRAEEYGDWPDKLNVSAYTRYVDAYHEKVLEINEMTRQQVNMVFENVAEIDARYAARMREHREKIKGQIAIVKTMTEFMDSMANGSPNMALLGVPTVNENCARTEDDKEDEKEENTEPEVIKWEDIIEPNDVRGARVLAECLREHGVTDQNEIDRILEWVKQDGLDLLVSFNLADINGSYQGQNKEEIYQTIMQNYVDNYAVGGDSDGKGTELNCYRVRENFSLSDFGTEECLTLMTDLYRGGYISEEDYRSLCYWNGLIEHVPSAEADKIRNMMREYMEHVITTVYIYDCLQVLAAEEITPEECCKVNEIFRHFGITDRNSIACLLICCAGESMGFTRKQETYQPNDKYTEAECGAGYLQVTFKYTQLDCLRYIYGLYGLKDDINTSQAGYSDKIADDYPWEASAWYWAVLPKVGENDPQPLNSYVMERLGDNGGELTLGIVLTAECFVHGDVVPETNINSALGYIARDDSLRSNDGGEDGGWYVDGSDMECKLHLPSETLQEIINRIINENKPVPSGWGQSDALEFNAPYNWEDMERYYDAMQEAGLLNFDMNTERP